MSQPFEVRLATAADLPAIQALSHSLFEFEQERDDLAMDWSLGEQGEQYFSSRIGGEGVCLVAESETREVIGYLAGAVTDETWRRNVRTELENMFVNETWRGVGVGQALVEQFFEWSRKAGAKSCLVEAYSENNSAARFYETSGFRKQYTGFEAIL